MEPTGNAIELVPGTVRRGAVCAVIAIAMVGCGGGHSATGHDAGPGDGGVDARSAGDGGGTDAGPARDGGGGTDGGPATPVSTDAAARACVMFASCLGGSPGDCFAGTVDALTKDQLICLASARSCANARTCVGTTITPDATCTPGYQCQSATILSHCVDGVVEVTACPYSYQPVGDQCIMTATRTDCGAGTCTDTDAPHCDGDRLLRCDSTIYEGTDCARYGMHCMTTTDGTPYCGTGDEPSCTSEGATHCDGTILRTCTGGVDTGLDCGRVVAGRTCTNTSPPHCGTGDFCDPTEPATCDGTSLVFCLGMGRESFDCTTLGFTGCMVGTEGARCGP